MNDFPQYETERLILKPTTEQDAQFVFELLNMPKWIQNIGDRNINTVEDAKEYIVQKMLPQYKKLGFGNYTIIRKSDGIKMGSCGLYDRKGLEGVDIGFAFLPNFEGKGYAFESANKIIEIGIHQFGLTQISAITSKENKASQRLLGKLGLRYKGLITLPNDNEELILYQIEMN